MQMDTVLAIAAAPVVFVVGRAAISRIDQAINRRWPGKSWPETTYRRISSPERSEQFPPRLPRQPE